MKALKHYFKNREDAVLDRLEKPRRKFTADTFHELRVEIKKLNALFDLIHFCSHGFKRKKTFKPYKFIFRQAGKVRELQLEEVMLDTHLHLSGDYGKQLKKLRRTEQEIFFAITARQQPPRLKKKHPVIIAALSGIGKKKVKHYLKEHKALMKELLRQAPLQVKQVHEVRKLLKTFNYNRMILASGKDKSLLKKKDTLSPLMGQWHDCQIMLQRIRKALDSDGMEEEEILQLQEMKTTIISDSERLFDQLNGAIRESEFFEEEQQQ